MTEVRANNIDMPVLAQRAFDGFVGFIYATTIALVIKTAYVKSNLDSIVPATLTLLLLLFFAYDWMARFFGQLKMSGKMTTSPTTLLLKLFLNITIVYFLLLVSLKLVELYAPLTSVKVFHTFRELRLKTLFEATPGKPLCYSMAAFAIFSGLWNAVMIDISAQVNKEQIWCLFKGHLDDKIVKMFRFIKAWQDDLRESEKTVLEQAVDSAKRFANADPTERESVRDHLKGMRDLYRDLGLWLLLKCIVRKPHHLLLPYFFVFHVVALNFVLGVFIALSMFFLEGESLFAKIPFLNASWPVLFLCFASLLLALIFLVIHFKSCKSETPFERLGCACLAITILLVYSVCPAIVLIVLVVCQQIAANFVMTLFFTPPPANETEQVCHSGEFEANASNY